ncbi:hypothetical protein CSW58_02580 [Caulobacter sp. B11]|uniref:DUF2141 domain-containing protein n=1 Tax=Caulobacter sp. B11 TaxID=2048899 RepID=UPI000C12DA33|nr:DUF2141 domain-containing protein [Caulobacter sp. B11]PHY13937.1 hypothetical protein CSW58_02580 [Caulobacter sp. B11]
MQPKGGRSWSPCSRATSTCSAPRPRAPSSTAPPAARSGVRLPNVPDGDYAVSVLHDVDGNFDMTTDATGKITEGWSTVNAAALRAKPTFDQVKVSVSGDAAISETMIYPK